MKSIEPLDSLIKIIFIYFALFQKQFKVIKILKFPRAPLEVQIEREGHLEACTLNSNLCSAVT